MKTQVCDKCGIEKDVKRFEWAKSRPNPRKTCAVCRNNSRVFTRSQRERRSRKQSEWYYKNKELAQVKARERNYGITHDDYLALMESQNSKCGICLNDFGEDSKNIHVDHCHKTGAVRGLLCNRCNLALGFLQDSPESLARAIEYLK